MEGTPDKMRAPGASALPAQRARKPDPAVYSQMRRLALETQLPNIARGSVHVVLMDWHMDKGTATVAAAADGSASLYLSTGGGYIGGSEKVPAIREAALHAIALATGLRFHFERTDATPLPSLGDVTFYINTGARVSCAVVPQSRLRAGADPLAGLSGAMQRIITEYRLNISRPANKA